MVMWVRPIAVLAAVSVPIIGSIGADAQDFQGVQTSVNHVLFAKEDAAVVRRVAEQRRIDMLDRQTKQQAEVLEQQFTHLRQLDGQLQQVRQERQLIDQAAAFDAAIVARDWVLARSTLAPMVTIGLLGEVAPSPTAQTVDAAIARLTAMPPMMMAPRYDQHVEFADDRATLRSSGFAWRVSNGRNGQTRSQPGTYEYRFDRVAEGWKISGITFQSSADTEDK